MVKEADGAFSGDDVLEGVTAVASVKLAEIQFEGQTKAKLGSTEAQGAVASVFGEAFGTFLEENPDQAKASLDLIIKNTYRTLMTRGMKGCFIYCVDKETSDYFKQQLLSNS